MLLGKYGGLSLYDIGFKKVYSIDVEQVHFVKKGGYYCTSNPNNPDGTSADHDFFSILDDLLDRILETVQNSDIELKVIKKDVSFPLKNYDSTDLSSKLRNFLELFHPVINSIEKEKTMFMII